MLVSQYTLNIKKLLQQQILNIYKFNYAYRQKNYKYKCFILIYIRKHIIKAKINILINILDIYNNILI